jgi:hypothetical protein
MRVQSLCNDNVLFNRYKLRRQFPNNLVFCCNCWSICRWPASLCRGDVLPSGAIVASQNWDPSSGEGDADGQKPCLGREPSPGIAGSGGAGMLDPTAIFASVGEVPYAWRIDTDALVWGRNVSEVLPIGDPAAIASGRGFAQLIDPQGAQSRADVVMRPAHRDEGSGVPYQVQYALRLPGGSGVLWIEDSGRWFAGPDGKPLRAHGVVRVINERHEREARLVHLSRFDPLTGEMNRWHMMEARSRHRGGRQAALLMRLPGGGDRQSQPHQRGLWLRRRRRGDCGGGQTRALTIARQGPSRAHVRQQVRHPPQHLHAGRHADRRRPPARRHIRDEMFETSAGGVAATITIGGITAPRYGRNVREVLSRAQDALANARAKRRGSFQAYQPNPER